MHRNVCYNPLRMVSIRLKWRNALKEGFNVKNGNSLKVFSDRRGNTFLLLTGAD